MVILAASIWSTCAWALAAVLLAMAGVPIRSLVLASPFVVSTLVALTATMVAPPP